MAERALKSIKNALTRPGMASRIVKAEWLAVALMAIWCGGVLALALSSALR